MRLSRRVLRPIHQLREAIAGVTGELNVEIPPPPIPELADLTGAFNAMVKVERLKAAEAQKRFIQQEKLTSLGLLAAGIAHEINNPMAYVTSNLTAVFEDMKSSGPLPEPLVEHVEDTLPAAIEGARRVNAIVADLRRFARGDPEALVTYDLNAEIGSVLRMSKTRFAGNVRATVDLKTLPPMTGRPRQISQALLNLVVNAAQAVQAKGGGTVRVESEAYQDGAVIRVIDDGIGLTEETRQRLFEPFFTTKPVNEGTGLGLSVTHGIITSHEGTIDVESAPGKGTTFRVYLPSRPRHPMIQAAA